jgi:hypothetical protein
MPGDEASHAEADHREACVWPELRVDVLFQRLGQLVDAFAGVVWFELRDVALDAVCFEATAEGVECSAVLKNAVDEHDFFIAWLGGLRMAGNGGGENASEKLEKASGHGKILSSKFKQEAGG